MLRPPTEFIDNDSRPDPTEYDPWVPNPVVAEFEPYDVPEKMLGDYSEHLESPQRTVIWLSLLIVRSKRLY